MKSMFESLGGFLLLVFSIAFALFRRCCGEIRASFGSRTKQNQISLAPSRSKTNITKFFVSTRKRYDHKNKTKLTSNDAEVKHITEEAEIRTQAKLNHTSSELNDMCKCDCVCCEFYSLEIAITSDGLGILLSMRNAQVDSTT